MMRGRQKTATYLKIMEDVMLPSGDEKLPVGRAYQQDNAAIRRSHAAVQRFADNGVRHQRTIARWKFC